MDTSPKPRTLYILTDFSNGDAFNPDGTHRSFPTYVWAFLRKKDAKKKLEEHKTSHGVLSKLGDLRRVYEDTFLNMYEVAWLGESQGFYCHKRK